MKTLAFAVLAAAFATGSTGCCCLGGGGCSPCAAYSPGCSSCGPSYGYAPAMGGCSSCGTGYGAPMYAAPAYGGGCPNGNCGVGAPVYGPQGAHFGPSDVMSAQAMPTYNAPVAMTPTFAQTAMAPLQSLPTY